MKESTFFAMMSRMKYISRWGLMHNTRTENLSEHCLEVAMIAHCLGIIHNHIDPNNPVNPERLCVLALYHDASEIITGDLPTPIKYRNDQLRRAYKDVEREAARSMLELLPEELRGDYDSIFVKAPANETLYPLLKAADKLSALIKCIEEENMGNLDFSKAKESQLTALQEMNRPEVDYFLRVFLPSFRLTLDEMK